MLAVHFGAGNIGRGFIGSLLSDAGYQVCFVDVNAEIVNLLNERNEYRVVLAAESSEETTVRNVKAINSIEHPDQVINAIAQADLVTTAVGPNILLIISDLIAKGLRKRLGQNVKPLNIIACENMIGASEFLKENVYEKLSDEEKVKFDQHFAFPNAAVDRIVPNQSNEDKLMVSVEPFYEWVVDKTEIIGEIPPVNGITFVDDLKPFIERKLFTVNTGHAVAAYIGYQAGYETIKDAMDSEEVYNAVKNTLNETGNVLIKKYGFDQDEHGQYINKILGRFQNPHINDEINRVARGPLRKLGANDRLVSPAKQYYQFLEGNPEHLAKAIAGALKYDFPEDSEAVALQEKVKSLGFKQTLQEVSGLEEGHPLVALVLKKLSLNE